LVMAYSVREALFSALIALSGQRSSAEPVLDQVLRPLPFAVVALVVWLYHGRVAARDRDLVGEVGGSATLRRWYLYGAAYLGLLTLLAGVSSLLETLWLAAMGSTVLALGIAWPVAGTLV